MPPGRGGPGGGAIGIANEFSNWWIDGSAATAALDRTPGHANGWLQG